MLKKIGIFAGTFDPVHIGHISFAELAQELLELKKVIFLPERQPRHKTKVTDFKLRQKMLEVTLAGEKNTEFFDTGESNFTIAGTLPILRQKYPESEFVILLGSDTAKYLDKWQDISNLEDGVSFLIALRDDTGNEDLLSDLSKSNVAERLIFVESPEPGAAASLIRLGKAKTGLPRLDEFLKHQSSYNLSSEK